MSCGLQGPRDFILREYRGTINLLLQLPILHGWA